MATTKTIPQYAAAVSIDATQDYLLIYNAGLAAYRKINRSTLLSVSGTPVDTSSAQSITGIKTMSSPVLTAPTINGTIAGTYTIGGTPTFPTTVLLTTGSQSVTGVKTFTSPVISGGSIDNATITVDSISGHTTSTIVSVGGVQMNNGVIGTAGAVVTNSIAPGAITPNTLVAASGSGWAWQSYTPALTNFTLGNGTMTAKYVQTGKTVNFRIIISFGSTTTVGSSPRFSLPVTANSDYGSTGFTFYIGNVYMNGNTANWMGLTSIDQSTGPTSCRILMLSTAGTYLTGATDVTASVPDTWVSGSHFILLGMYEGA